MQIDLDQKLVFQPQIITSNHRTHLALFSTLQKLLFIVKMTVPEAGQCGWHAQVLFVAVECKSFATSTTKFWNGWWYKNRPSDKPLDHCQRLQRTTKGKSVGGHTWDIWEHNETGCPPGRPQWNNYLFNCTHKYQHYGTTQEKRQFMCPSPEKRPCKDGGCKCKRIKLSKLN